MNDRLREFAAYYGDRQNPAIPSGSVILLLLGGDSTMTGAQAATTIDLVPPDYLVNNPKVKYLYGINNSYSFVDISVPFNNNYPLQYGYWSYSVEMKCSKLLSDYFMDTTVYVVKYGQNGATIAQNSATPYNYNILKEQCLAAISIITNTLGRIPIVPVLFMSVGSNDCNQDIAFANAFQTNLNTFYTNIKTDLSLPDLRIGIGRISANSAVLHKTTSWAKLDAFVAENPTKRFQINTDNDQMHTDQIHYIGAGYDRYGEDLFNKIKDYY